MAELKSKRFQSERFIYDISNYLGSLDNKLMCHIKVFCKGAMQVDLWFTKEDREKLKETLNYEMLSEEIKES